MPRPAALPAVAKRTKPQVNRMALMEKLAGMVGTSIEERKQIAAFVAPYKEDVAKALVEMAMGIWYEVPEVQGEKRVYRRPPNAKCIEMFWQLLSADPVEQSQIYLTVARADQIMGDIDAGLTRAKTRNLDELTQLASAQRKAFIDSQVSEQEFKDTLMQLSYEFFTIVMAVPRETILVYAATDEGWSIHLENLRRRLLTGVKRIWQAAGYEIAFDDMPEVEEDMNDD